MNISTDLSDEHFLMLRAAGYEGQNGAQRFKKETLLDIVSCDYRQLARISRIINAESGKTNDSCLGGCGKQEIYHSESKNVDTQGL
jgi:7-keto-8-aminopelargonate synthetase-like enzyme